MPETSRPRRTRAGEVRSVLSDLQTDPAEGLFSSLGMLITDSVLSGDEEALTDLRDGLRSLIGRADRGEIEWEPEPTGRARSLLIGATAGLVRVAPARGTGRRKVETLPGI